MSATTLFASGPESGELSAADRLSVSYITDSDVYTPSSNEVYTQHQATVWYKFVATRSGKLRLTFSTPTSFPAVAMLYLDNDGTLSGLDPVGVHYSCLKPSADDYNSALCVGYDWIVSGKTYAVQVTGSTGLSSAHSRDLLPDARGAFKLSWSLV